MLWFADAYELREHSFGDWLSQYAEDLESGVYAVYGGRIQQYRFEPDAVARTSAVSVAVGTVLDWWAWRAEPELKFAYNIRMRMSSDAPPDAACELTTRHWRIRDRAVLDLPDGEPSEHVDGEGVIGLYPLLQPGVRSTHSTTRNL